MKKKVIKKVIKKKTTPQQKFVKALNAVLKMTEENNLTGWIKTTTYENEELVKVSFEKEKDSLNWEKYNFVYGNIDICLIGGRYESFKFICRNRWE